MNDTHHDIPWLLRLRGPDEHPDSPPSPPASSSGLPSDTLGLALSGGGVRSAAFCLGVIQSLARQGWLPRVDLLSTVSGGGYIGAFLGRAFDVCRKVDAQRSTDTNGQHGVGQERVGRDLSDSRSPPLQWLRKHSDYLSPSGKRESITNVAGFWRNVTTLYLVLGIFVFAVLGILNAFAYARPTGTFQTLLQLAMTSLAPLNAYFPATWIGSCGVVAEVTLWLAVVPLLVAYWLTSQDLPEAFLPPVLFAAGVGAVALVLATGSVLAFVVLTAAIFWSFGSWFASRQESSGDPLNHFRLLRARNHLTRRLAFWLSTFVLLLGFTVIDRIGYWLADVMRNGGWTTTNVMGWFVSLGSVLLGVVGVLRAIGGLFVKRSEKTSRVLSAPRPYLWAAVMLLGGAVPPLVFLSFTCHSVYGLGTMYWQGVIATVVALIISRLLGTQTALPFVNHSTPLGIYAARLARAFFGAVNPRRRTHPDEEDSVEMIPGDDVPIRHYRPELGGGPLHLINCAVNETIDVASQRGVPDRQAENLAVGPAGMNLAQHWHANWVQNNEGLNALLPLGDKNRPHPLLSEEGVPVAAEDLYLRQWIAISGAAVGPGSGRRTGVAKSLLLTLGNIRLGYWWNSGLGVHDRANVTTGCGLWEIITNLMTRWFSTQALLLSELIGRFGGPWYRHWYLSDGGNFEVTGAYELLRRRVPFVIVCDGGQDRDHQGGNLALLIRLARVDMGAEVTPVDLSSPEENPGVPDSVRPNLGSIHDLLASGTALPRRHAALLLVRYPKFADNESEDPWLNRTHTWVLYVKATQTGDEPADVTSYAATHPDFPNESTLDQNFDEAQWESYRKLGEHIGAQLFA